MNRITCILSVLTLLFAGEYGEITGKVVDAETGKFIQYADVVLEGTELGATTGENGDYTVLYIPVGMYSVFCKHPCHLSERFTGVVVHETTVLNISLKYIGQPTSVIVSSHYPFHVGMYGTIKGKITDGTTDESIACADINIEKKGRDAQGYFVLLNQTTNLDGEYIFESVPVGFYKFVASKIGYKPYYRADVSVGVNDTTIVDFSILQMDTILDIIHKVNDDQDIEALR